jgi:hypothetical protein
MSSAAQSQSAEVRIGDFVVERELGCGSFATVYLARDASGAPVAIKAVPVSRLDASVRKALEAEVRLQLSVRHPNVLSLREVQRSARYVLLILDYAPGGDLGHAVRERRRLPEPVVARLVAQLAAGLEHLWQRDIVHRDLKLTNLLLSGPDPATATLMISDFGFARRLTGSASAMADTLCGSPLYMAPELLRYERYDAKKADLWSVGVLLVEMLTGRPPFTGANPADLLATIERHPAVAGPLPPAADRQPTDTCSGLLPPAIAAEVSEPCKAVIRGLLRKDPAERFTAARFLASPWIRTAGGRGAPAAAVGGGARGLTGVGGGSAAAPAAALLAPAPPSSGIGPAVGAGDAPRRPASPAGATWTHVTHVHAAPPLPERTAPPAAPARVAMPGATATDQASTSANATSPRADEKRAAAEYTVVPRSAAGLPRSPTHARAAPPPVGSPPAAMAVPRGVGPLGIFGFPAPAATATGIPAGRGEDSSGNRRGRGHARAESSYVLPTLARAAGATGSVPAPAADGSFFLVDGRELVGGGSGPRYEEMRPLAAGASALVDPACTHVETTSAAGGGVQRNGQLCPDCDAERGRRARLRAVCAYLAGSDLDSVSVAAPGASRLAAGQASGTSYAALCEQPYPGTAVWGSEAARAKVEALLQRVHARQVHAQ